MKSVRTRAAVVAAALLSLGLSAALAQASGEVAYPDGYRRWVHISSHMPGARQQKPALYLGFTRALLSEHHPMRSAALTEILSHP